jgi:hypothetical protein
MEANPALVRPAGPVVLHAVAREDVDPVVAQLDWDLDLDLAIGGAKHGGDVVPQLQAPARLADQCLTIS